MTPTAKIQAHGTTAISAGNEQQNNSHQAVDRTHSMRITRTTPDVLQSFASNQLKIELFVTCSNNQIKKKLISARRFNSID
jgi:hypothetical protein